MKTNFFSIFSVLVLAILCQTTVFSHLEIYGVVPNLILVVVVLASLSVDWQTALPLALLGGISLDLFSTNQFGFFALILIIISFLFSFLKSYLFTQANILVSLIAVLMGTSLYYLLALLLADFFLLLDLPISVILSLENVFIWLPLELAYNLAGTIFIFFCFFRNKPSFSGVKSNNRWI